MNDRRPALFFDRDGVVNMRLVDDYVRDPGQLRLLPDIGEALRIARELGYVPVLVTNQQGIARQLMTERDLGAIHATMQERLRASAGTGFEAIYVCPHHADDRCDCRKPMPGMLLRAADELGLDLQRSWMIGDSPSDVEAGRRAGCMTAWLGTGEAPAGADIAAVHLREVMAVISRRAASP